MRLEIVSVMVSEEQIKHAANDLDQHVEEMINWHFSPESGCPFWLNWAKEQDFNPLEEVRTFAELCDKFPYFEDEWLRDLPNKVGCHRHLQIDLLTFLKRVELRVCPSNELDGMIFASIIPLFRRL